MLFIDQHISGSTIAKGGPNAYVEGKISFSKLFFQQLYQLGAVDVARIERLNLYWHLPFLKRRLDEF